MFLFHAVQFIKQIRFQVWKKEGILAIPKQMAFFGNAYLNVPWNSCSSSSDVFSFWLSIHCFDAIDFGFYMAFRTIETLKNSMNPNIVKNDKSQIVGFFFVKIFDSLRFNEFIRQHYTEIHPSFISFIDDRSSFWIGRIVFILNSVTICYCVIFWNVIFCFLFVSFIPKLNNIAYAWSSFVWLKSMLKSLNQSKE